MLKRKSLSSHQNEKRLKTDSESDDLLEEKKVPKGRVKDVYQSDSSHSDSDKDDSEKLNFAEKDDPNDMFAEQDDMFDDKYQPKKKDLLKKQDLEAQEWSHDPESLLKEEDESGIKITPFNMDADLEEGSFDDAGNYIANKKEDMAIHDSWLEGISKKDISAAQRAKSVAEERIAQNALKQNSNPFANLDLNLLWRNALVFMNPGETMLKALARIGKLTKVPRSSSKKNMSSSSASGNSEMIARCKSDLDSLSSISSQLFEKDPAAYDKTYEQIILLLSPQGLIDPDWIPGTPLEPLFSSRKGSSPTARRSSPLHSSTARQSERVNQKPNAHLFEYKWPGNPQVFGPFPRSSMKQWADAGFFQPGTLVRPVFKEIQQASRDFSEYQAGLFD